MDTNQLTVLLRKLCSCAKVGQPVSSFVVPVDQLIEIPLNVYPRIVIVNTDPSWEREF